MILVFTNKEDAHPNPVFDILEERGVPFFRLNTEDLLTDYSLSWKADNKGCDFTIVNKKTGHVCRGSEVTAIWDRRPETPKSLPISSTPEINKHNLTEASGFLAFLRYSLMDIPSIGSILNDRPASSKMLQYALAQKLGFDMPETCFSNQKHDIQILADKYDYLILKSIESNDVWDEANGQDYVFYASKVPSESIAETPDEAFYQTVSFAQNYIEKDFELRVTVVDDKVFACKIDSQRQNDETGKIDWRQGYDHGLVFEEFDLPVEIEKQCIAIVHSLGLNFGCIDLIVKPDGGYVFLECNPNGQWLWVELTTGQRISEAIADFFTICEHRKTESS